MYWGFSCGDGWFDIINELCAEITNQVQAGTMPSVVASQVKEKSGYLRFYIRDHFKHNLNPQAHHLIDLAQQKAEHTCEQCGAPVDKTATQSHLSVCPASANAEFANEKQLLEIAKKVVMRLSDLHMHPPRDPARINVVLDKLREVWGRNPDLRLAQLILNAAGAVGPCSDFFYLEDEVLLHGLAILEAMESPAGGKSVSQTDKHSRL
jgi:uncharacterized protein YihD (DUF1040 family)